MPGPAARRAFSSRNHAYTPFLGSLCSSVRSTCGSTGPAAAAQARGVGNQINVYVTVEGSIRSDRELAKVVEAELVRSVRLGGAS